MEGSPFHTAGTQRPNETLYPQQCWSLACSLTLLKVEPGSASKGGSPDGGRPAAGAPHHSVGGAEVRYLA